MIFVFVMIGLFTTPALAWGKHHGWHRGGPRIIVVPPPIIFGPRCTFVPEVAVFPNSDAATEWVNENRRFIYSVTYSVDQYGTTTVYYSVQSCH